jgi:hypothetical protein
VRFQDSCLDPDVCHAPHRNPPLTITTILPSRTLVIRRHKHQGQHPECHQMCLAGALAQLTVMSARFCLGAEVMYVRQWLCGSVQNCTLAQKRWHDNLHNHKIHTSSAQCKSHFDTSGGCIETHFFRRAMVRVLATPGRHQGPSGSSRKTLETSVFTHSYPTPAINIFLAT